MPRQAGSMSRRWDCPPTRWGGPVPQGAVIDGWGKPPTGGCEPRPWLRPFSIRVQAQDDLDGAESSRPAERCRPPAPGRGPEPSQRGPRSRQGTSHAAGEGMGARRRAWGATACVHACMQRVQPPKQRRRASSETVPVVPDPCQGPRDRERGQSASRDRAGRPLGLSPRHMACLASPAQCRGRRGYPWL